MIAQHTMTEQTMLCASTTWYDMQKLKHLNHIPSLIGNNQPFSSCDHKPTLTPQKTFVAYQKHMDF